MEYEAELCASYPDVAEDLNSVEGINDTNSWGRTALHGAVVRGKRPEVMRALIKLGADVNAVDSFGRTPLHTALSFLTVNEEHIEILKSDENINHESVFGITPLHTAALHLFNKKPNLINLLIDAGADPNAVNCFGSTPQDILNEMEIKQKSQEKIEMQLREVLLEVWGEKDSCQKPIGCLCCCPKEEQN